MSPNVLWRAQAGLLLFVLGALLDSAVAVAQVAAPAKAADDAGAASNDEVRETSEGLGRDAIPAEPKAGTSSPDAQKVKPRFSVRVRSVYEYRSQGDVDDADLYGYWYARGRDLANGHVDFYTSGRLHADMDGSSTSGIPDATYASLDDLRGVTEERVLQCYVDIHDSQRRAELRGGRQYIDVADYLHIDGGQLLLFEDATLGGRIYAGKPVSYYTSVTGDLAMGASIVGRPWTGNRTRLSYALYDGGDGAGSDHEFFADSSQAINDTEWIRARLSLLNGDFRMASFDASYFSPDGNTSFYFGGSRWGEFEAETRFYSPFTRVLGAQAPYSYGYVRLSQALSSFLAISPGVSYRVTNTDDAAVRNRDYSDYDVTLSLDINRVFSAALSVDYWDTEGDDSFLGISGEIRCRGGRKWDVSLGTAYADYSYDSYSDITYSINGGQTYFSAEGTIITETPYSYTYFLRTRWTPCRNLTLRLQGDVEDESTTADLGYRGRGSIEVRL